MTGESDRPASEQTREEKLAAIRARAEALRAAKAAAGATSAGAATPGAAARPAPGGPAAAPTVEVPVSSLNPGGRPATPPQSTKIEAYGTINQSVELRADPGEAENLKKLLGGLGAYQNPLRAGVWQVDYRYYAEARRRLEAAGYTVTEQDYLDR
ncbi:MAG: hypothetical protein QN183_15145, partial [Armatimonadota bacterium]|nr:hypothetical protein [Armatimonadota bacterium]